MSKLIRGRVMTIGAAGIALLAGAVVCFLLLHWQKAYPLAPPVTSDQTWNTQTITIDNVTVDGANLTIGGGNPVNLTVTGDMVLQNGGKITIDSSQWPVTITIVGNLTVNSGSKITADGKGFAGGTSGSNGSGFGGGKGNASGPGGGAGYGGSGVSASPGGATYGDTSGNKPLDNGSGGGCGSTGAGGAGGGAINIKVTGTTISNGPISANGVAAASGNGGAGSGGSIYLQTNELAGSDNITATGGTPNSGASGYGGGGRVAVYYNEAANFNGNITANGGGGAAGNGSIVKADSGLFTGGNSGTGPMGIYPAALFTGGNSGIGPMGVGYYYASATVFVWSGEGPDEKASTGANWQGGVAPGPGSDVVFTELSGKNCTWDINTTPPLGTAIASFTLETAYIGKVTLGTDLTVTGSITMAGGKLDDGSRTVSFTGVICSLDYNNLISSGSWILTDSGTVTTSSNVYNTFKKFTIKAGKKATVSDGNLQVSQIILEDNSEIKGDSFVGANVLSIRNSPAGSDFITQGSGAQINTRVDLFYTTWSLTQGTMTINGNFLVRGGRGLTDPTEEVRMSGNWEVTGGLTIFPQGSSYPVLNTQSNSLNIGGNLLLGTNGFISKAKILFGGGTHSIGGNISVSGGNDPTTCITHGYIDLGSSTINLGGNFDLRGASVYSTVSPYKPTINFTGTTAATLYGIVDYSYKDSTYDTIAMIGKIPVYNFTCSTTANASGKTINVNEGDTLLIGNNGASIAGSSPAAYNLATGGNLSLTGVTGKKIIFQSTNSSNPFIVDLANGYATNMNYLDVKYSNVATGKTILVDNNSTLTAPTTNWVLASNAGVYWTNGNNTGVWSDPKNWSTGVVPLATDNVYFSDVFTANCSVDTAATVANLTLDTSHLGNVTLQQDLTVNGTIAIRSGGGILVDNGKTVKFKNAEIVGGDATIRLNSTGNWKMTSSGNISNPNWLNSFRSLELADGTSSAPGAHVEATLTGIVQAKKIILGDYSKFLACPSNMWLYIGNPDVNDFVVQKTGTTISPMLIIGGMTADRTQGMLTTAGDLEFYSTDKTLTMTGDWSIGGRLYISGASSGTATLDTRDSSSINHNLTVIGKLYVGVWQGGAFPGQIMFRGGTHSIGGDVGTSLLSYSSQGYLDFGSATVNVSGDLNFTNAAVSPTATIGDLTLNSGATLNMAGTSKTVTIPGSLTINSGATFAPGTSTVAIGGDFTVVSGATFTPGSSTAKFTATSGSKTIDLFYNSSIPTVNNLVFDGGGIWKISKNLRVGKDLSVLNGTFDANNKKVDIDQDLLSTGNGTRTITMGSGSWSARDCIMTGTGGALTVNRGTSTMTVSRNWDSSASNATYNVGSSKVNLIGDGSFKTGMAVPTFYDLTCAAAPTKTTTLDASSAMEAYIENTLTLGGGTLAKSAGANIPILSLRGSGIPLTLNGSQIPSGVTFKFMPKVSGSVEIPVANYGAGNIEAYATTLAGAGVNFNFTGAGDIITTGGVTLYADNLINTTVNLNDKNLNISTLTLGKGTNAGAVTVNAGAGNVGLNAENNSFNFTIASNGANHVLNMGSSTWYLSKNWSLSNGVSSINFDPGTSTVVFNNNLFDSNIYGDNVFNNFKSVTPDKQLYFEGGKSQRINGKLLLSGGNSATLIGLAGIDGAEWNLNSQGTATIAYVNVSKSNASSGKQIIASGSNGDGTNLNWLFTLGATNKWTGNGSNDLWSNPENWSLYSVPTVDSDVVFDATSTDPCIVDSAVSVKSLKLDTGYTGTVTLNANLTTGTGGFIINQGIFNPATYKVTVNGGAIKTNGNTLYDFEVAGGANTLQDNLTLNRNITLSSGTFNANNKQVILTGAADALIIGTITFYDLVCNQPSKIIKFEKGKTQTVTNQFNIRGGTGYRIKLRSTLDETQWNIRASGTANVVLADIKDSVALDKSITTSQCIGGIGGNNINWVFTPTCTWVGSISNSWSVGGNWLDGAVPTSTDVALFNSSSTNKPCLIDSPASIKDLTFDTGYTGTVSIGAGGSITSAGNIIINPGAAGILNDSGQPVNFVNLDIEGGALISTGKWTQTATGEIKYTSPSETNKIGTLAISGAGVETTLASDVYVDKIEFGTGILKGANNGLHIHGSKDFIVTAQPLFTVDPASKLGALKIYNCSEQGAFTLPDNLLVDGAYIDWLYVAGGASASGAWNFGNNKVRFTGSGIGSMNLSALPSYGITAGDVQVGSTADANNNTIIDFGSGTHTINSISKANSGAISGTPLQLKLSSSTISSAGALNFTGIKVYEDTSTLNLTGATQTITTSANADTFNTVNLLGSGPFNITENFKAANATVSASQAINCSGSFNVTTAFTPATSTVTLNGSTSGLEISLPANNSFYNLTLDGSGAAWTLQSALKVSNNFIINQGALTDNGKAVSFMNLSIADAVGVLSSKTPPSTWTQTASGTIKASNKDKDKCINILSICGPGITTTFGGDVAARTVSFGTGELYGASYNLYLYGDVNSLDCPAVFTVKSKLANIFTENHYIQGEFKLPNDLLLANGYIYWRADSATNDLAANGNWDFGNNRVAFYNTPAAAGKQIILTNLALTCGDLLLGKPDDATAPATLNLNGGIYTVKSIGKAYSGSVTGALKLLAGNSTINCSENIDFTDIAFTPGVSSFIMNGGAGLKTIKSAGQEFYKLNFNDAGMQWKLTDQLTVQSDLELNAGSFIHNNQKVALTSAKSAKISGAFTFYDLECTAPDKVLTFSAERTQTIANKLTINGQAEGTRIKLYSSVIDTPWSIEAASSSVKYVNVKDSTALKTIVAISSMNEGGNTKWIIGGKFTFDAPVLNDSLKVGNPAALTWKTYSGITKAKLYYTSNYTSDDAINSEITPVAIDINPGTDQGVQTTYSWAEVPNTISNNCRIKIVAFIEGAPYPDLYAVSSKFNIVGGLTLKYPTDEGIGWPLTLQKNITWVTGGTINKVNLYCSTVSASGPWDEIALNVDNNETYSWEPDRTYDGVKYPALTLPSGTCYIKVENANDISVNSISSYNFIISAGGLSNLYLKLGSDTKTTLISGLTYQITWETVGTINTVNLDYSIDNGSNWNSIEEGVTNSTGSNFYNWIIPHNLSDNVLVRVSDTGNNQILAKSAKIKIVAPFTINAPATGNILLGGSSYTINWSGASGSAVANVKIEYTTNGTTWAEINGGVYTKVNDLSETWNVPALATNIAQIRISDANDPTRNPITNLTGYAYADSGAFKIKAGNLALTSPNIAGVVLKVDDVYQIQWTKSGDIPTVKLYYCTNANTTNPAGPTWLDAVPAGAAIDASLLQYPWTVPPEGISETCKVKIVSSNDSEIFDISDVNFSIKPKITLNAPNGGQSWVAGAVYNIVWAARGMEGKTFVPKYSIDNGATWNYVIKAAPYSTTNESSYGWTVPDSAVSNSCLVRVESATDSTAFGQSAAKFYIVLPTLSVLQPKKDDVWVIGDSGKGIEWSSVGTIHNNLTIEYSALGDFSSDTVSIVASNQANSSSYLWSIPNDNTIIASKTAKIRIRDLDWEKPANGSYSVKGESVAFEITAPRIDVTAPAENARIAINTNFDIKWTPRGSSISMVNILYSPTGDFTTEGVTYYKVPTDLAASAGTYTYNWETMNTIPLTATTSAKIRIVDASNQTINGDSGAFRVVAGTFKLTVPDPDPVTPEIKYFVGKQIPISWSAVGIPQVKLSYSKNGNGADAVWYNMDGSSASTAPTIVSNSDTDPHTYDWTVPDIVLTTHDPNTNVYVKLEDPNDPLVFDALQLTVAYYQVKWKIVDEKGLVGDLAALVVQSVDVTTPSQNFELVTGQSSGIIRYYYPNKKYNTIWSRDAYLETMASNWEAYDDGKVKLSDGTIIDTFNSSDPNYSRWVIKMPQKLITKALTVQGSYYFDPDSDALTITGWLMQQDAMIAKYDPSIGVPGVTEGFVDVYDDENTLVSSSITAVKAVLNNNGTFNVIWTGLRAGNKLVVGKNYFARLRLLMNDSGYIWGGISFQITSAVNIQGIQQSLGVNMEAGETVVSKLKQTLGVSGEGSETIAQKISDVKGQAATILTATQQTIPQQITQATENIATAIKTEVKPHVQSGILTRTTTIKQNEAIDISYRTTTGLAPTITVYDPKDRIRLNAQVMKEIEATGVYVYNVKFSSAWGKGDFTVVCTEPTQGTVDALVMTVVPSSLEDVAGQVSAVLGSTSGIKGLKDIADTLNTQFGDIDSTLAKLSSNIVGKVTETKDTLNNLQSVFVQLESISKQIQGIGGTEGINLEKLYNVSKDKKDDVTYIKNKTQELKAAMDINQKLMQNVANKPVVQTWFEFK